MKAIRLVLSLALLFAAPAYAQTAPDPDKDYAELDTKPRDPAPVWDAQKFPVAFQWGSIDVRYPKYTIPAPLSGTKWTGKAWKGERLNAQALLWTNKELKNATLSVSDLRSGSSVIPSGALTPAFVRYVMTDELNKDGKGACGHRPDRTLWDSSLVEDVLDIRLSRDIGARTTQPVWLSIQVPRTVPAGKYRGALTVTAEGLAPMRLPLEVEVLDRTLPVPHDWKFHLDLWQNPYAVARQYGVPLWSVEHFEIMRPLMQKLASAGQKVITATIMHKPWAGQTQDAFESMVFRMKKIDGSWAFDYTVFDAWVEFMMGMGIDRQINCFSMVPWAYRFDYYDQASNRVLFVEAKPGEPAYEEYWYAFLKDFARHLRERGWFGITTISMDERGMEVMKSAIDLILRADPEYKISGQGHYFPQIEPFMYDLCLAYGDNVPDDVREARRKAGKITTVYTCCTEARPNFFTFSPPAEAVWTIWHAVAGQYDGYLRWAYNSWTLDPLRDSRFRTWAAGDCYLIYPERSSIRLERLIEGVQDAEKIRILREEFAAKGMQAQLEKLDKAVSAFMPQNLTPANAGQMVSQAQKALNGF